MLYANFASLPLLKWIVAFFPQWKNSSHNFLITMVKSSLAMYAICVNWYVSSVFINLHSINITWYNSISGMMLLHSDHIAHPSHNRHSRAFCIYFSWLVNRAYKNVAPHNQTNFELYQCIKCNEPPCLHS